MACKILGSLGRNLSTQMLHRISYIFKISLTVEKGKNGSISDRALNEHEVTLSKVSDTKGKQDQSKTCAYQTTLLPEALAETLRCESCKVLLLDTAMRLPGSTRDRGLGAGPGPRGREVCGIGQERKSEEGVIKRNVSKDIGRCLLTRWLGKLPTRRSSPLCLLPKFTVWVYKVIAGRQDWGGLLRFTQKAQGGGPEVTG